MAQRIVIPVLGGTMGPYGSKAPTLQTGNISENQHFDVLQLGRGVDTTAATRALYPFALSYVTVTNGIVTSATQTKTRLLYLSITAAQLDALAG